MAKKKHKKAGRRRKYETSVQLSRAVDKYFASISYELPYTDPNGEPIKNLDGEDIVLIKYVVPPSLQELCLFLDIDASTWENYAKRDEYKSICQDAKLKVEAYLTRELNTRDKPQGIIFNLENNFDWKKKKEVELGEGAQKAIALSSMTIEEKEKLLAQTLPELLAFSEGESDAYEDDYEDE